MLKIKHFTVAILRFNDNLICFFRRLLNLLLLFLHVDVTLFHFNILLHIDNFHLVLIQHIVKVFVNNLFTVIVYMPHADIFLLNPQFAYGIFNRFYERIHVQLHVLNRYVRNSIFDHFLLEFAYLHTLIYIVFLFRLKSWIIYYPFKIHLG